MLENQNSGSSMLEHWKILHDRAFARAFDQKCTIFAKICLFSKAVLHRVWKNRASSGLEHAQKWKFQDRACSIIKNWLRTGIFRARACLGATLEVRVWLGLTVGWGCQKRNQWSIFLVLAANTVRIMDVLPAGAKVMSAMMYPFPNK